MQELIGREVEVLSTEGVAYKGILVEVGEVEVYIRSEGGWIVVPTGKVIDIRAVE